MKRPTKQDSTAQVVHEELTAFIERIRDAIRANGGLLVETVETPEGVSWGREFAFYSVRNGEKTLVLETRKANGMVCMFDLYAPLDDFDDCVSILDKIAAL